ncbi:MAG: NADP-dependent isocitrate dehydrogenase [Kiritimatiellae bacterium]|nr:NADP-dependent isocitrate dehydrogenase [Kiritimatiellia bacterium]MDW8459230.1 NADP-dependent isocitrate dehydrogenase [Verrucomicrobiota bacterium]
MNTYPVAIARGDGIGPEIMEATLAVLDAARAPLAYREIELGEAVYLRGHSAGIAPETWSVLRETGVLLKAPITTPQGGGYKSLNVTLRKALGLFANVRPVRSYHPFVDTKHPNMDVVIIRENEEDVYAGIEHRQTEDVYQCLKLITRPGSERLIRYAFEYARHRGRRKVTCMTKDNIMKMTDGLFHKLFEEIGAEYPDIERNHMIVDIGMARIADAPELFSVVVTPNLYGDIVSDIVAEISGSVGLAPSANIGEHFAMFEAIHGSAPDIAGKGIANPSGLLLSAVKMLAHLGLNDHAETIHNAWLKTIEDGQHTADLYTPSRSRAKLGTLEFAQAVIARLGQKPERLPASKYVGGRIAIPPIKPPAPTVKKLVGVDVFVCGRHDANALGDRLRKCAAAPLDLQMVTNRGVKVWPDGLPETFCVDHWRCRFIAPSSAATTHRDILALLGRIADAGIEFVKTEHLYEFDGKPGFSLGQGQ